MINQQTFETKFAKMSDMSLVWTSSDIRETLKIWQNEKSINDPYMVKLWAEFDACTAEIQKRQKSDSH